MLGSVSLRWMTREKPRSTGRVSVGGSDISNSFIKHQHTLGALCVWLFNFCMVIKCLSISVDSGFYFLLKTVPFSDSGFYFLLETVPFSVFFYQGL